MATAKATAPKFSLSKNDFLKGLIVAVITPVFTVIIQSLEQETLTFNWAVMGKTALGALLAYLTKNFLNGPSVVVQNPTPKLVEEAKKGNVEVNISR